MKPKLLIVLVLAFLGLATYFVTKTLFGTSFNSFVIPTNIGESTTGSLGMMGRSETDMYYPQPTAPAYYLYPNTNDTSLYNSNRVYLKNSAFGFVVPDTAKYVSDITNYFLSIGGRLLTSQINTTDKFSYAYLQAKIPVAKFDEVNLKVRGGVRKIISANTNSADDTARLDTSTTRLDQLKTDELAKQQAIAAEKNAARLAQLKLELKSLQDQIKTAQAQVGQVTAQTDYATVTLTLADNERYFRPTSSDQPDLRETWDTSVTSLTRVFLLAAAFFIQIAVFSVLWLPIVLIILFISHKLNPPKTKTS